MPFYLHYTNYHDEVKNSISFENNNGFHFFCHVLHFKENKSFLLYPRRVKDKTERIKSLLDLFTKIVWHTGRTIDVYSIYESLLSKYGFALLKREFPSEKFNEELIDNVEKEINYLIADAMEHMPIDYPEDNSIDCYNDMYFGGMAQDELDAFRDNIE
tara:strand:- start:2243 stop:2716 length:474 start_codon:yes stop_codon:yes gene_type:complete